MKYFLIIFLWVPFKHVNAQIYFNNAGLEGVASGWGNDVPPGWNICSLSPDILPVLPAPWLRPAFEGISYEGIGCFNPDNVHESFGQKISSPLPPDRLAHFTCMIYSAYLQGSIHNNGKLQLWGGNSLCDLNELLFESENIDTVWNVLEISFTPSMCYQYLTFRCNALDTSITWGSYLGIDALSEITVEDYNFFSFPNTDTTINKGECVTLTATSDDTSATFYWSTAAGDSVSVNETATVCPTTTTTYICTATLGCGQQFKDTITITVIGGGNSGTPPIKIPNLLNADNPTWQILYATSTTSVTLYNTLGQLVYQNKEYNNTLNTTKLASATYFYEVKYGSNTYRGKLMVVR